MPQNPNVGDLIRLNMCVLCWPVMELTAVALKLADSLLATRARLKVGYKYNIGNRLKVI
jgi:hypothetical protein